MEDARVLFHKEMRRQDRVRQAGKVFFNLLVALCFLFALLFIYFLNQDLRF